MRYVLDDELLNGSIPVSTKIRPYRFAEAVGKNDIQGFRRRVEIYSQLWAGVAAPIIPVEENGRVQGLYEHALAGEDIDAVLGSEYDALDKQEIFVETTTAQVPFGAIFSPTILRNKPKDQYLPLEITELEREDPWQDIYAICLGNIPEVPDPDVLKESRLLEEIKAETFINVNRESAAGSLVDLVRRLSDYSAVTPRKLSINMLASGMEYRSSYRGGERPLPEKNIEFKEAGPNIIVVCSPENVEDLALLWNLRAAHSESYVLPIGVPRDFANAESLSMLFAPEYMALHSITETNIFVTSVSISPEDLKHIIPGRSFRVVEPSKLVTFGPAPGRSATQVVSWHEGSASINTFDSKTETEVIDVLPHDYTQWKIDVSVPSHELPNSGSLRLRAFNQTFFAGKTTCSISLRRRTPVEVQWPSRFLSLKATIASEGYNVRLSEPGKAALTLLESLDDVWELDMLAHKPLIDLLQSMSERQGINWAKKRAKERGGSYTPSSDDIAPASEDLIEQPMDVFRKALGNNQVATTAWLNWAEDHRLIIKGFPLQCSICEAKQWVPVMAFSPPIHCNGCEREIRRPFPQGQVNFKYRLGETMRRLFAHDALGHLLTLRYFVYLMGGSTGELIGLHPGLELFADSEQQLAAEVDVVMFLSKSGIIPIEVKKSFQGVTPEEISKLDKSRAILASPWTAISVTDYAHNAPENFSMYEQRGDEHEYYRRILAYDQLLDPSPIWGMGTDPFAWRPLNIQEISERENKFVKGLVERSSLTKNQMLELGMFYQMKKVK